MKKISVSLLVISLLLVACAVNATVDATGDNPPTPKEPRAIVVVTQDFNTTETKEVQVEAIGCVWGQFVGDNGRYIQSETLYCYSEERYSSTWGGWVQSYVASSQVFSGRALRWYVKGEDEQYD